MKLLKKIFNSVFILLGIGLMVVLFCFALMMFFKISMFGYTYISYNEGPLNYVANFEKAETLSLDNLKIETDKNEISIIVENRDSVLVALNSDIKGICKDNVKKITLLNSKYDSDNERYIFSNETGYEKLQSEEYNSENGFFDKTRNCIIIKTSEPTGLIFSNGSSLKIHLPLKLATKTISIKTSANTINFDSLDKNVELNNLEITSNCKLSKFTLSNKLTVLGTLSLYTDSGRTNVESVLKGNVNINSNIGTFLIKDNIAGNVMIEGEKPSVEIGDVSDVEFKAKEADASKTLSSETSINGNLTIIAKNGALVRIAGSVNGETSIQSKNVEFWANNINGMIYVAEPIAELHIVGNLNTTNDCSILAAGDSAVVINECHANNLAITGDLTDINIKKAFGNVNIKKNNKLANVTFANTVSGKTFNYSGEGKVVARNVSGTTNVITTGTIDIEFLNIVGENKLTTTNEVKAKIVDGLNFTLTTSQKIGGSINVQMSATAVHKSLSETGVINNNGWLGYTDKIGNNSNNSMTIKSDNGPISCTILNANV